MPEHDLVNEIFLFIDLYAKPSASYDPDFDDEDERFNGPDSAMLFNAAKALQRGEKFGNVHSTIGSGCYRDWNNPDVAARHDRLVGEINALADQ